MQATGLFAGSSHTVLAGSHRDVLELRALSRSPDCGARVKANVDGSSGRAAQGFRLLLPGRWLRTHPRAPWCLPGSGQWSLSTLGPLGGACQLGGSGVRNHSQVGPEPVASPGGCQAEAACGSPRASNWVD